MNVSASSGASAAWMLQRLFENPGGDDPPSAAGGADRQKMPGAGGHACNAGGSSAPQMSGGTVSVMVTMQMQAPPSASDVASSLIDALDTNGDGVVSAEEISAAFDKAGLDTSKVSDAVSLLDTDGDGQLNTKELTTAISSRMEAHRSHPSMGPPPEAGDVAASILGSFDTDADGSLSLSEIASALGKNEGDNGFAAVFKSMDADGDDALSSQELTAAIQSRMDAGYRAYARSAQQSAELA